MQQQFPITYADKNKGRIQIPAATPKEIQLPSWKKHRVESPTIPLYYYTPEKEEEEGSEDQKFTYQNPILENPEIETPNFQTQPNLDNQENNTLNIQTPPNQDNQNPDLINQQNLPPVIVINQPPINLIAKPVQQPLQLSPQQSVQQQLFQQPSQQLNINQMVYTPIAKLENFTGEEDDAQTWINNISKAIIANNWDDTRVL
ncbi:hypothetical protein G9A89_015150 [Geosiphon pyriformis]|nr:hypothetical protein G9A89_015150 [Geosiphon pyriformis]